MSLKEPAVAEGSPAAAPAAPPPLLERRGPALFALAVITLAGAAIRFHRLGALPLWNDEGATLRFANKTFAQLWGPDAVRETNPPLYYSLQRLWLVLGDSEAALRSLAAVLGIASIALIYLLAAGLAEPVRRRRVGLLAAALFAASSIQVAYAQEARAYNMTTACAAGVLVCLSALLRHPGRADRPLLPTLRCRAPRTSVGRAGGAAAYPLWAGYTLSMILLLYSHNAAVVLVALVQIVAAVWWLTAGRRNAGFAANWMLCHLLVLLTWSWWLPKIAYQARYQLKDWWIPPPTGRALWETAQALFLAMHLGRTHWIATGLVLLGAVLGLHAWRRRPLALALSAGMAVGGLLLLFALSFWRPMFLTRAVLWTGGPMCVLIAAGLVGVRPKPLRWALAASLLLLSVKNTQSYFQFGSKPAWDQAAAYVSDHDQPDDPLVFIWAHHDCAFSYYYPDAPNAPRRIGLVDVDRQHFDPHDPGLAYITLERVPYQDLPALAAQHHTTWVITDQPRDRLPQVLDPIGSPSSVREFPGRIRIMAFDAPLR